VIGAWKHWEGLSWRVHEIHKHQKNEFGPNGPTLRNWEPWMLVLDSISKIWRRLLWPTLE